MRITESHLRRIVREELIREGDVISMDKAMRTLPSMSF